MHMHCPSCRRGEPMREVEVTYLTLITPAKSFRCTTCNVRWGLFYQGGEEILVDLTAKPRGMEFDAYVREKIAERFMD